MKMNAFIICLCIPVVLVALNRPPYPYISPGIQLGYTIGEGYYWGAQVTAGVVLGRLLIPGVTYSYRQSSTQIIQSLDFQMHLVLGGIGYGRARIVTFHGAGSNQQTYKHFKSWMGLVGIIQYDYLYSQEERLHTISALGVYPFMTEDSWSGAWQLNYFLPQD